MLLLFSLGLEIGANDELFKLSSSLLDRYRSETPDEKNTWRFSATMPNEVARIAKSYMETPFEVTVGGRNAGNENIEHKYYVVHARDKYLALKRIA